MSPKPSVLIIDESPENRETLRDVLRRRGASILETGQGRQGLEMLRRFSPDLVVLDVDTIDEGLGEESAELGKSAQDLQIPVVALATARRQMARLPTGEFMAKPYHYGPLIRKIESLLKRAA